jgi:hypothetical protein
MVDEVDIAEAVRNFDLVFSAKPVRMSILSATLTRAFASGAPLAHETAVTLRKI